MNNIFFGLMVAAVPVAALLSAALLRSRVSLLAHRALFLLVLVQLLVHWLAYIKLTGHTYAPEYRFTVRLGFPFAILSPFLVYVFFRAVMESKFSWRRLSGWHLVPFALGWVYYFGFLILGGDEFFEDSRSLRIEFNLRLLLQVLVSVPYLWSLQKLFPVIEHRVQQTRSDLEYMQLLWLKFVMNVSYLAVFLSVLDLITGPDVPIWPIRIGTNTLAVCGLLWIGLSTSALFEGEEDAPAIELSIDELSRLKAILLKVLAEDRLFLKPGLKLSELAEAMGVRPYIATQVLKQGLQSTFYDVVNQLRVNHAKHLLQTSEDSKVLTVALECGFNSKSTFNDAFRRIAGMTPSEYRRTSRDQIASE